jgi:hypothetical protein
MSKQVFKYVVPQELLFELLDKICEPSSNEYYININAYKRMKFHNYHIVFLNSLVPYYHFSKRFYVERECTYTSFITIVRQLCRMFSIEFISHLHYGDSRYAIEYKIQKPPTIENK